MKTFQEYLNEQNILQRGMDYVKSKLGMQTSQQKAAQRYADKTNPALQAVELEKTAQQAFPEIDHVLLNTARLMNNAGYPQAFNWQQTTQAKLKQLRDEIMHNLANMK